MATTPKDDEPARRVRDTWDRLSRTPWRDFYIASHAGWDDAAAWQDQALIDLRTYLSGVGRRWLARQQVLEVGCGVGRLAGLLAGLSLGYTGIDISAGMLDEAQRRCRALPNARFLLGSGSALPTGAADRRYGVILAVAVFIHCPRELVEGTVRSAWLLLASGGTFRFQLRVDRADPEAPLVEREKLRVGGADDEEVALPAPPAGPSRGAVEDAVPAEALALAHDRDYAGHAFKIAEARSLLAAAAPGATIWLHRPGPDLLYAVLDRP